MSTVSPATCPRCRKVALDDLPLVRHCPRCKGSWISEDTLHQRAAAARDVDARRLTWRQEARAALMCAICASPMEALVILGTPVDRCAAHGVWFDANELAHVLLAHAAARNPGESHSDIAADVAETGLDVASETVDVVEVGGGVFEVVVEGVGVVAETVVEIVAGIFSAIDL
jgi:Zn-finger nucleic acid-binding protein